MSCGIYKITNKKNGKSYIGQSTNIKKRKGKHFYLLSQNKHENKHLQRAYNKYGKKNFLFEIIAIENDKNKLNDLEKFYICFCHSMSNEWGYNIRTGGDSNFSFTSESKARMSASHKGKINACKADLTNMIRIYYETCFSLTKTARILKTDKSRLSKCLKKQGVFVSCQEQRHWRQVDAINEYLWSNIGILEACKQHKTAFMPVANVLRKYNLIKPKTENPPILSMGSV